jgi:DNA-binding CsgD family transcriptional regulator/PAS domain-containing protein
MSPQHQSDESISLTIAAIYDAAVAPERLPVALGQLRDLFGVVFAFSEFRDPARSHGDGVAIGIERVAYQKFLRDQFQDSAFYAPGVPWYVGQVVRSVELVPNELFHRTPMYQEVWRPRRMRESLRLAVSRDEFGSRHMFNLAHAESRGEFTPTDIRLAHLLMPHLQAADRLTQRLSKANMLAAAAFSVLDALRHAVFLLDRDARILHCNHVADALLQRDDRLVSRRGALHTASPAHTNRLAALLARAAGRGGLPPGAGTLRLALGTQKGGLALLAMPFRQEAEWSLIRAPAVLLCVTDLDVLPPPPGRQMAELFGLTAAEGVLAADLLAGLDLREIAERRGRSINTVRTHLARLMAKTDVNRQSELMRLLVSLPRLTGSI